MIADKNYYGREFEATLAGAGLDLLRPARKGEPWAGTEFFKPLRQVIESINDTFKGEPDLENGRPDPSRKCRVVNAHLGGLAPASIRRCLPSPTARRR